VASSVSSDRRPEQHEGEREKKGRGKGKGKERRRRRFLDRSLPLSQASWVSFSPVNSQSPTARVTWGVRLLPSPTQISSGVELAVPEPFCYCWTFSLEWADGADGSRRSVTPPAQRLMNEHAPNPLKEFRSTATHCLDLYQLEACQLVKDRENLCMTGDRQV